MKIPEEKLVPVEDPISGFAGDLVYPKGSIILPVIAGTAPKQTVVNLNFLVVVVDVPGPYNALIGLKHDGGSGLN